MILDSEGHSNDYIWTSLNLLLINLKVDPGTLEFELDLRKILENQCDLPEGLSTFANVHRSFGDISHKGFYSVKTSLLWSMYKIHFHSFVAIWDDVSFLIIGFISLYAFVQIMIGRLNRVEQRVSK